MTSLLDALHKSIDELLEKNCERKDLIICFSPLIENYLIDEVYAKSYIYRNTTIANTLADFKDAESFNGISINRNWPYNEIVVYDQKRAYQNDYFISKIEMSTVPDLDKPPLGLMPKYLHDEKRFEDIRNAMDRCACAGKVVPQEWIEERKELLEKIKFKEEEATKKYTEKELLEAEEKAFNAAKEIVVVPVIDNTKKWKEMQIRDENYKTFSDYKNGISQGALMIDKIKSFIRGKV